MFKKNINAGLHSTIVLHYYDFELDNNRASS